jgi:mono/diheme cytochrome c family protein
MDCVVPDATGAWSMTSTPKPLSMSNMRAMLAAMLVCIAPDALARDLFKPDAFTGYRANVENGKYMMNAAGCAACHAPGQDLTNLSGGLKMDTFIGTFFVPNITAHTNGIGGWSNSEFLNAVINGVGKDGRHLYPVMPYTSYGGMKPEDVLDIKAYIETLTQSDKQVEKHRLSFPYNLSATIAFWKRGNFDTPAYQSDDGSQLARGRYLVENVGGCAECHTPRTMDFGLDKSRSFEGEKGLTGAVAPAITSTRLAGVSEDVFVNGVLVEGKKLNGTPISDPVMKKYVTGLATLSEDDRRAILAYLKGHEIAAPEIEATAEAACREDSAIELNLASADSDGLAGHADDFIGKYCRNCHGPGESAQGSFPAGDLGSIASNAAFVTPGDRDKSLLYTSVNSGRMPYGKRPSVSEIEQLGQWIDSLNEPGQAQRATTSREAERKRPVLAWRSFAEAAVRDLGQINQGDRPFIRYFSYRMQYNGKLPCEDEQAFSRRLELYKAGFHKLLNSLSLGPVPVVPDTVEETTNLLVRVDIRDLKWDSTKWDRLVAEYPFGYDPDSDAMLKTLSIDLRTELPIMRVDWFMANAPKPTLYHALLELPENISTLETTLGVDVNDNIRRRRVVRAGFEEGASGVSDHNRMIERHDLPQGGYYWKSYDFAGSHDRQDIRRHPHGPAELEPLDENLEAFEHDGGEMIFSLPNGLQGYYLSTEKGDRLDRGPTEVVSFRQRPIGKGVDIINGRSCMDCHADGIIAKRDQLREYIDKSPAFTLAQRDLLLEMYVGQGVLDKAYANDRARFVDALDRIGASEVAPDGTIKSLSGPGKSEIVTWYADLYEDDLDAQALAAEFDMTEEQFEQAVQRIRDSNTLRLALDWLTQLKGGSKIPRFEVEQQFAGLTKPLLDLEPLQKNGKVQTAGSVPDYKNADYRDDAFKGDDGKTKLELKIAVKNTDVFIDEILSFDVTANRRCELQVFYVEADGNVEIIPQEMIGKNFLEAETPRQIPDPASGDLVFDAPALNETLLLFCREGGLGEQRLSAEEAKKLAEESGQPASRGLAIKLFEKAKQAEENADAHNQTGGKGTSAIHMVTFNVKSRQ